MKSNIIPIQAFFIFEYILSIFPTPVTPIFEVYLTKSPLTNYNDELFEYEGTWDKGIAFVQSKINMHWELAWNEPIPLKKILPSYIHDNIFHEPADEISIQELTATLNNKVKPEQIKNTNIFSVTFAPGAMEFSMSNGLDVRGSKYVEPKQEINVCNMKDNVIKMLKILIETFMNKKLRYLWRADLNFISEENDLFHLCSVAALDSDEEDDIINKLINKMLNTKTFNCINFSKAALEILETLSDNNVDLENLNNQNVNDNNKYKTIFNENQRKFGEKKKVLMYNVLRVPIYREPKSVSLRVKYR